MSVLGVFCEDIDFPNGTPAASTNAGYFRSGFARCAMQPAANNTGIRSKTFETVTSCWLSARIYQNGNNQNTRAIGLCSSEAPANSIPGIYVGSHPTNAFKLAINKWDGTTLTTLASEAALSFPQNTLIKVDFQVINYGVNSTVNLYVNGSLLLSYTGDITIAGITSLDTVAMNNYSGYSNIYTCASEIIVADESTLGWQGVDLREITANGTTQQWSNPDISNFDPITINDANSTYSNTAGQDEQAALANSVAGNFAIKAVKIVARANAPAGSAVTNLKLGFRNGSGTVGVGTAHTLTTSFAAVSDLLTTDPTTGQPFTSIDGYQLDLRSA